MARKTARKISSKEPKGRASSLVYLDTYEVWLQKEVSKKLRKR